MANDDNNEAQQPGSDRPPPGEQPLQSWKEIAAYLDRDERTARRWEKSEGLPVRRHRGRGRGSVYGYPSEIDAWRVARRPGVETPPPALHWRAWAGAGAAAACLLALFWIIRTATRNPVVEAEISGGGMATRQIWDGDWTGSPSPDGRYLSFTDWSSGDLAIRNLDTGQNRRVTRKGSWKRGVGEAFRSIFSPDGRWIAYNWFNDNSFDLRVVSAHNEDAEPRILYRNREFRYVEPAGWSSAGNEILVYLVGRDQTSRIAMISAADGKPRFLKSLDWSSPGLRLSPDGRWISYDVPSKQSPPSRDIFLLASDGSRDKPLTTHRGNDFVLDWTPQGEALLFASERTGALGIWALALDDGAPVGSPILLKPHAGSIVPMGMTASGTFFYAWGRGMTDVFTAEMDALTGELLSEPVRASTLHQGSNHAPAWSPDGERLFYRSLAGFLPGNYGMARGVVTRLILRSGETGKETETLPQGVMLETYRPAPFSPEGRRILARALDENGRWGLYSVDVESGRAELVLRDGDTDEGFLVPVGWSPDGASVYYRNRNLRLPDGSIGHGIFHLDLESREARPLYISRQPDKLLRAALSPAGDRIVFRVLRFGDGRGEKVLLMPAQGGAARLLYDSKPGVRVAEVAWSPDGRWVMAVVHQKSPLGELWRIPIDGGAAEKTGLAADRMKGLSFHPDGRTVAFQAGARKMEVWALENFLSELTVSN